MSTEPVHFTLISGDELHNQNCYEFLLTVWRATKQFQLRYNLLFVQEKLDEYDPDYAYGDLYTTFLTDLEKNIDQLPANEDKTALLNAIYLNQSHLLERTAERVVTPVLKKTDTFTFSKFKSAVTDHLNEHQKKKNNSNTPQEMGSVIERAWSSIGEFSPMKSTSIPCIKKYNYKTSVNLPTEIRMGTQAEYTWEGETGDTLTLQTRINPLFTAWIKAQETSNKKITHVYFNLLGRDRTGYEGNREKALTAELEAFEKTHSNIAVITLPADHEWMNKIAHQHHTEDRRCSSMFSKMLDVTTGKQKKGIRDFYISEDVKAQLYSPRDNEAAILKELIQKSFKTILNIDDAEHCITKCSPAQLQAVYFHFIKYELTNFILEKLEPVSFNTSCKDGIDRGGVASLYYNLMKSIALGNPLSEEEFQRGLHAASTMVKGRGINHHGNLIWNAIHHYIKTNNTNSSDWLKKWRDDFAPNNSKVSYAKELMKYVADREKKGDFYHSFFSTTHSKSTKINAAKKLKIAVENPEMKPIFTAPELNALKEGRLGKLADNIAAHGVNFMQIYIQQLKEYKNTREKAGTFHTFFGRVHGFSKAVKLCTVEKLIKFLETNNPQPLQKIEWDALHDGKLGNIVKDMVKSGFDLSRFKKTQDTTPALSMQLQ